MIKLDSEVLSLIVIVCVSMITGPPRVELVKAEIIKLITPIIDTRIIRRAIPPIWKDLMQQHISMQYSENLMLTNVMHSTKKRVTNYTVIDLYLIQDTTS